MKDNSSAPRIHVENRNIRVNQITNIWITTNYNKYKYNKLKNNKSAIKQLK